MLHTITCIYTILFFATVLPFLPLSTNQFSDTYQQRGRGGWTLSPPQIHDFFCFFLLPFSRLLSYGRGATDPRQNISGNAIITFFAIYHAKHNCNFLVFCKALREINNHWEMVTKHWAEDMFDFYFFFSLITQNGMILSLDEFHFFLF